MLGGRGEWTVSGSSMALSARQRLGPRHSCCGGPGLISARGLRRLIGLAYFSIPLALGVFLYHRRDVRFSWVIWMFVAFIMLCGVTHFMAVWTLWRADCGVEALLKAATAIASVVTALALRPLLPRSSRCLGHALEARIAERDEALTGLCAGPWRAWWRCAARRRRSFCSTS